MRSSISNSDPVPAREIPRGRWAMALGMAVVFALVAITVVELRARESGYDPSLSDTADQWSRARTRLTNDVDELVVIGSSRIQFDLDLPQVESAFGRRPIQLAMVGSNPLSILEHLAEDTDFQGRLIIGATPGLWFAPPGSQPAERSRQAIGRFENWAPSQRFGSWVSGLLQDHLAFINPEDLTLAKRLDRLGIPDRASVTIPPSDPPHFGEMDHRRQVRMWEECDFETARAIEVQNTWLKLFVPPQPPPHMTPEEFGAMMEAGARATLGRIGKASATLQERGARIVFVRCPNSGKLAELEGGMMPRERGWNAFLATTQLPGIHFADFPELSGFECPEWSHLTAEDAQRFTAGLIPHLEQALGS